MAVRKIAFPIVAYQNTNDDSTAFGKWFWRAWQPKTLSLKGLLGMIAFDCKKQGVNDVADVSVNQINGVRINFIPENAQGEELTSKKFKDTITFNRVGWIQIQKVTPQGKKPYYQQILHPFNNVVQVAE